MGVRGPPVRLISVRSHLDPKHSAPDFGRISAEHAQIFVGVINTLHSEPTGHAFARLLQKSLQGDDYVLLAHIFEEISVLALHHLIPEALLFDAFAFDLYWDELREDVMKLRNATGNDKLCENFEIAAERAREYRADRPPKTRWMDRGEGPSDPEGGLGARRPGPPPHSAPSAPSPEPVSSRET